MTGYDDWHNIDATLRSKDAEIKRLQKELGKAERKLHDIEQHNERLIDDIKMAYQEIDRLKIDNGNL